MSKVITLTTFFLICSHLIFAQWRPTGNLTIFSDDGIKFYLVLNGIRYNDEAQSNIRVEELPNPYYSCRIIFENNEYPAITKKHLPISDANGMMQDVTYHIRKNKKDKYVINFYSYIPAVQNMVPPPGCAVYRFGAPNVLVNPPVQAPPPAMYNNSVLHQSHPHHTQQGQININAGGIGVNVTVPNIDNQTLIHDNYDYHQHHTYAEPLRLDNGCAHPMNARDFSDACYTIKQNGFDETRLNIANQIAVSNCLSTNQIMEVMGLFSFEETKLTFAKIAFESCTDPGNYFKVGNAFTFESSKTELNNYISGYRH